MNDLRREEENYESTRITVLQQLALLQTLSLDQLKEKWCALYNSKPPKYKKQFFIKRLSYRIQELYYGGLSEETKAYLKSLAAKDPMSKLMLGKTKKGKKKERILPGTRFVRIWKAKKYEVIARDKGFEYEGCIYRSLSAIAKKITGAHWNGNAFFGVNGGASSF